MDMELTHISGSDGANSDGSSGDRAAAAAAADDGTLQLLDPNSGMLVYKDADHLVRNGAQRVKELFEVEIFNVCKLN